MRLKMQLENLTLMLLCVIALLSFFIGLMLFVRYSFNWLIFENVADSFYLRLLAYLGGAAGPLLIVNVLLNFLMYSSGARLSNRQLYLPTSCRR